MDIKQLSGNNLPNQLKADQHGVGPDKTTINNNNQRITNPQSDSKAEAGTDRVNISSQAQKIQQAIDSLQSISDVNSTKVADLKTAVSSGSYQINSSSTANKLLGFEIDLHQ